MLHRRKQRSLRIQNRGWPVTPKRLWTCKEKPRSGEQKLLEKESKQKAIDVDAESTGRQEGSTSKKARGGKGQGDETSIWTKESLPPGHWQDRPRSSESQETKEALRQKLEAHRKEQDQKSEAHRREQEQFEEHHKQKLQKTIATHFEKEESGKKEESTTQQGPGEDEAGSDPSSEESSESSDATEDQECGRDLV